MSDIHCPWCFAKAVEVTVSEDRAARYLCTGHEGHRWQAGEEPSPVQDEPVALNDIAEAVAVRLKEKLDKPSFFHKFFSRS